MLKQYPIAEARNHLTSLVRAVEQEEVIELTRRGEPVAVLLSIQEYRRLTFGRTRFWEAYMAFQNSVNLSELDIQPDIFARVRDVSPGREVTW